MIKKTITALIVAGLAATSGFTYAADNTIAVIPAGYIENTTAGCSLLKDRVTINTSGGVTLVYNCLTTAVKINVGGCHASGSAKPTTLTCVSTGTDTTGAATYNDSSCTDAGQQTTPRQTFTIAGRRAYTGSTAGGSVGGTDLGSTTCDVASLSALGGVTQ